MRQEQFLTVVSAEEAARRWADAMGPVVPRVEEVALADALGRVTARDALAPSDVPSFDRSNLDGFAVRAADTFGAEDERPRRLRVTGPTLVPGVRPGQEVGAGEAVPLATGAMLPRGADAVVPVEHTDLDDQGHVLVRRPVVPGAGVSAAGSDLARGETLLRAGETLTSRETGTLAAAGLDRVAVVARPRVGVLSTGGELVPPGRPAGPAQVHDANATILADAVREGGGTPVLLGIVPDDAAALRAALERAVGESDLVLVSGGTSKGGGDLVPHVVEALGPPGLVVHGVDLKPGKPLGLGVCRGVPIALLPGFPTSAVFTFHELVAPLLRRMAGVRGPERGRIRARLPHRLLAERGRTEYLLVNLVERGLVESGLARDGDGAATEARYTAYPMGKGSGSVTSFARADGFVRIPGNVEHLDEGAEVEVTLLGRDLSAADLVVIGSHCVGLDVLLGHLGEKGLRAKALAVGSTAGLEAARRGACDVAPVHLLDPETGVYNEPFRPPDVTLVPGYRRRQALCWRPGDGRFEGRPLSEAVAAALADPRCRIQNRTRGSGTRVLIDGLLHGAQPPGFTNETRSHHAVAAAVAQGRADWGVCLEGVAKDAGLATFFVADERFDFFVPTARAGRESVRAFVAALDHPAVIAGLAARGLRRQ
jgi:putative molybdopterin biosynthesis protein